MSKKELHICVPNYRAVVEQPHYQSMYFLFHALGQLGREVHFNPISHTVVATARQHCVLGALAKDNCSHVVFIDDDMVFDPRQFFALEKEFLDNGLDFLSALPFSNSMPTKPCVFGRMAGALEWGEEPWWHIVTHYPMRQRFECYASGFGMAFLSVRMLEAMRRDDEGKVIEGFQHFAFPHRKCPNEDIAFALNARQKGFALYCDSRVSIGHISKDRPFISEELYAANPCAI